MLFIAFFCFATGSPGWAAYWALLDGSFGWYFFFLALWIMKGPDENKKADPG